jgi:hypothetical protein
VPTFILVDRDGDQLGPFRTSTFVWEPGDVIPRGHDSLRVLAVDAGDLHKDGYVRLIVEPVE